MMQNKILAHENQQVNPSTQHQRNGTQQNVDPTNGNPSKNSIPSPVWDAIPSELKAETRWILWQARPKPNSNKLDKVPIDPQGHKASVNDSRCWLSFEQAQSDYEQGKASGVGFVLGDVFSGVDIDDCIDESGNIAPEAQEIITRLDSYTEISPSGRGAKIFLKGKKSGKRCRKDNMEIYDSGRFFTVTGRHVDVTPNAVNQRQDELDALYQRVFGETSSPKPKRTDNHTGGNTLDDTKLLQKAKSAENGEKFRRLWSGDASDYPKENGEPNLSAADLALCNELAFWTDCDRERMDRLFRQSGLYREKWDEVHNGKGQTYGEMTIDKAIADCDRTYDLNYKSNGNGHQAVSNAKALDNGNEGNIADEWIPYSDVYNADRFVEKYGQDYVWVDDWNAWLVWTGKQWKPDNTKNIENKMEQVIRDMIPEAQAMNGDNASNLLKHIASSLNQKRIRAAVECLKYNLAKTPDDFDRHGDLFNVQNGTIDLRTGELRPHQRENYITQISPDEYRGLDYRHEDWDTFLEQVQPQQEMRDYLSQATGYTLSDSVEEQCLFYLYGKGSNGKTTFINAIRYMMGTYARPAPRGILQANEFIVSDNKADYAIADLFGVRMAIHSEVEKGARLAESLIKDLTGEDQRKGRHPYGKRYFEYNPTDKSWLYGNHKLEVKGTDDGIWRRIHLIEFKQQFKTPNKQLGRKLLSPEVQSAILSWAVRGTVEWYKKGLDIPDEVLNATKSYREEMDDVGQYLNGGWCTTENAGAWTPFAELYQDYSERFGGKLNKSDFGKELTYRGFREARRYHNGKQARGRLGIGILTDYYHTAEKDIKTQTRQQDSKDSGSGKLSQNGYIGNFSETAVLPVLPVLSSEALDTENVSQTSNQADSSPSWCGYPSDLESDPFIEEWYINHAGGYIKPKTAQSIAQAICVEISDNLVEFAERVFLMPDGVIVQVMYTHNRAGLEGLYLDAIYQLSNGNGHGKTSETEMEIPF